MIIHPLPVPTPIAVHLRRHPGMLLKKPAEVKLIAETKLGSDQLDRLFRKVELSFGFR